MVSKRKITATQLGKSLSDFLNRVMYRHEEFVVERNGEEIAKLTPSEGPLGVDLMEFVDEFRRIPRPDDRFAEDLAYIHSTQGIIDRDLWPD